MCSAESRISSWHSYADTGHLAFTDTPELVAHTLVWLTKERREWLRARYVSCNWDMGELVAKQQEIVDKDLLKVRLVVS